MLPWCPSPHGSPFVDLASPIDPASIFFITLSTAQIARGIALRARLSEIDLSPRQPVDSQRQQAPFLIALPSRIRETEGRPLSK
ncbi:hypothetical protein SKP52_13250 [Sphingopyxis fribergensis]|uniref:Uncharacterized protein n=1 Tax=Sphingopyxis fribergensis TaxID=1515612 RepID=A0A0A7PJX6_9SPHN|nr:hypothetical protein SKP52_13250 [Sphingopyxis fribergensis]